MFTVNKDNSVTISERACYLSELIIELITENDEISKFLGEDKRHLQSLLLNAAIIATP